MSPDKHIHKICPKSVLGALLGASGGNLGAKRHRDPPKDVPGKSDKAYLAPSWPENSPKIEENPTKKAIKKSIDCWLNFL